MIDRLLSILAPHPCSGCGKNGTLLCDDCKYNIINESFLRCLACGRLSGAANGTCAQCTVPYARAWCVAERADALERLINVYKFENGYRAHQPLADLLLSRLDQLPAETVIVPLPTVAAHVRQRGYDHTLLIAKRIATARGHVLRQVLRRRTNTKQRDANRATRIAQAKEAFVATKQLSPDVPYLIIDDVVTTGATIRYAAETLRAAGAQTVWVAAIARQPLD